MMTTIIIIIITPTNLNNFDDQYKRDWKSGHGQEKSSKSYKVGADVGTLFAGLLFVMMVNIILVYIWALFILAPICYTFQLCVNNQIVCTNTSHSPRHHHQH